MFKRVEKEVHSFAESELSVSYDRFSTKFTLIFDGRTLVSKRLAFTIKHEAEIEIESKIYKVHVFSFILWRSKLTRENEVVIMELIPSRRRKSIGALIYSLVLGAARLVG